MIGIDPWVWTGASGLGVTDQRSHSLIRTGAREPHAFSKHSTPILLALMTGVGAAYAITCWLLPADGFWINDNGSKFILMESILRTDYRDFSIAWPGQALDPGFEHNPLPAPFGHVNDGRLFSTYSAFFPLAASFAYRWIGSQGLYALPLLGGLLTLPAVWLLVQTFMGSGPGRRIAQPLAVCLVAFCTPMWFYSVSFWEYTPAVCLTTWSVWLFVRYVVDGERSLLMIAGLLCGIATCFRDEFLLFAAVLACAILLSRRSWAGVWSFTLTFLPVVGLLGWFQALTVDSALGYHLTSLSPFEGGLNGYLSGRLDAARSLLVASHRTTALAVALSLPHLILWLLHPRVSLRTFVWLTPLAAAFAVLSGVVILAGHLSAPSPLRWLLFTGGLFATTPVMIMGFIRLQDGPAGAAPEGRALAERSVWLVALLYPLFYLALTPVDHARGIHWGCRYLLPVFPLFAALAASTTARWWLAAGGRPLSKAIVAAAIALTLATQLYSLRILYQKKQHSALLQAMVSERPENVIIAQGWYVPQELARVFFDKPMFLVRNPSERRRLATALQAAGYDEALLVSVPPEKRAGGTNSQILRDGGLGFMTVELRHLDLGSARQIAGTGSRVSSKE